MNQQLPATAEPRRLTIAERIEKAGPEFAKALPGHIPPEKFVRTIKTALTMQPDIGEAASKSAAGMQSLLTACTKAATDGLIIDGREAALVTFNQKVKDKDGKESWQKLVQYMPMVAGLMKKARNSGQISAIDAIIVRKNDRFSYNPASDDAPDHQPDWFGNRGEAIGVYAVVRMKDGTTQVEVMSKEQVMRIAAQSKNAGQYNPESGKNFEEWWRKTAIRRISKYLPSSSDRDEFMQAVSRIDDGFDFDQTEEGEIAPTPAPAKKRGAAAAKLKDVTPDPKPADPEPEIREPDFDPETGEIYQDRDDGQTIDHERQPGDDI